MRELRLVPAAILTWAAVLVTLITRQPWAGLVLVAIAAAAAVRFLGESLTAASLAGAGVATAWLRLLRAPESYPFSIHASVASTPTQTRTGGWALQLDVGGVPVRAFAAEPPPPVGSEVLVTATASANDNPEVSPVVLQLRSIQTLRPPEGFTAWALQVKEDFRQSCAQILGPASEGLVPGMVLGDTSAQDTVEKQMYLDTGLSHLTAVSGSNITILTVAAVLLAKACTLGPRIQVAVAAVTLGVFVAVVGFEPSVLRASVMGIVGLLAVLGSAQVEPAHGLCVAVIALLLYDSNLASSFGFALSVAATAGLVALSPLIYRALARLPGPDIVKRALAVAIAAELVTMPLVAAMSGHILLASIPANLLAAPAVAPVTILGLIGVAWPPVLHLAEPFAWWIATVARTLADAPSPDLPVTWTIVFAGWLLWLIHAGHARWLLLGLVFLVPRPGGPEPAQLGEVLYLSELPPDFDAPAGVTAVVVDKPGRPSKRPHVTRGGVPILFPNRDGPVTVYVDGTQRAERGHF